MTFRLSAALISISIIVAGVMSAAAQEVEREIEISPDSDYFGFDLRAEQDVTLQECQQSCIDDPQCKAFTYNTNAAWCFLKSDFGELKAFDGAVAGKIIEVAREPDIGPAPELEFLTGNEVAEALAFRQEAEGRAGRGAIADSRELLSTATSMLAAGNTQGGANTIMLATGSEPDNVDTWLRASRLIQRYVRANGGGDWNIRQMGSKTAINAYRLSRTTSKRAEALRLLGEALEYQSVFRPALSAYKNSLELVASPELAATYQDLRRREGFRITGNTVDAESNNPRICVQFSEPLVKTGVDYSDFVTLNGRGSAAIDVDDRQICVTGLDHGESYQIAFRAGLPSTVDEVLEVPVTINSYVRDRQASVRFSGENFVLPRQMRQGIPVIGINADKAEMEMFRIGDRALANLLSGSDFLSQLGGYSIDQLRDDLGEAVWKGTLDLETERNREVTTSFPVSEVLEAKQPGIYILTAKASGSNSEYWSPQATQWFLVSDIGLTTYAGADGLRVFSRSLDSAKPKPGTTVTLIARNNEILGSSVSDDEGVVLFEPGLMRGTGGRAPTMVTASLEDGTNGNDFVFIDLARAGFDLSDRGVTGRAAPGPVDVFTWTDRGIYRPGESIHAVSLARDDGGQAIDGLPLTIILQRPDGVEAQRLVSNNPSQGGHETSFDIPENGMRGVWRIGVYVDPERDPVAEKMVLVEDFVPDRIEFDLTSAAEVLSENEPNELSVDAQYLYGAPASGLALEGEMRVSTTREVVAAPGYKFGLDDEDGGLANLITLAGLPKTDETGQARLDVNLGNVPVTTRPLTGEVFVRLREDGGRVV
ncbi:MAG: MG2 domain-containing protein, partial [Pseudomonadota bacterium]